MRPESRESSGGYGVRPESRAVGGGYGVRSGSGAPAAGYAVRPASRSCEVAAVRWGPTRGPALRVRPEFGLSGSGRGGGAVAARGTVEQVRPSAVDAQRAIREAGVARASPSSSSSRADGGSAAVVGRPASAAEPSSRSGANARPNRSAQAADTASTAATVPCPAACPPAVRSRRSAVATSPLSIATAPHSRNAMDARQAASYVAATGEVGEAAGVSARQIRWMPAAAPAPASRAVVSRRNAVPGSPSRTTTVCGPVWARAASARVARSR